MAYQSQKCEELFCPPLFEMTHQTDLEGEKGLLVTTAASNRKDSTIYLQSECSEQAIAEFAEFTQGKMDDCWLNDLAPV